MKTAEEILKQVADKSPYVTYDDLIENVKEEIYEAMRLYAKEAIVEAAKAVKIKWVDIEYDEEKREMVCEPEIDIKSILSLINELR